MSGALLHSLDSKKSKSSLTAPNSIAPNSISILDQISPLGCSWGNKAFRTLDGKWIVFSCMDCRMLGKVVDVVLGSSSVKEMMKAEDIKKVTLEEIELQETSDESRESSIRQVILSKTLHENISFFKKNGIDFVHEAIEYEDVVRRSEFMQRMMVHSGNSSFPTMSDGNIILSQPIFFSEFEHKPICRAPPLGGHNQELGVGISGKVVALAGYSSPKPKLKSVLPKFNFKLGFLNQKKKKATTGTADKKYESPSSTTTNSTGVSASPKFTPSQLYPTSDAASSPTITISNSEEEESPSTSVPTTASDGSGNSPSDNSLSSKEKKSKTNLCSNFLLHNARNEKIFNFSGFRVVELGESVSAAAAGVQLSDMGVEVIKIENIGKENQQNGGDPVRNLPVTSLFQHLNRGKKSVGLDLEGDVPTETLQQLHSLIATADVLLVSYPKDKLQQLGLDYDQQNKAFQYQFPYTNFIHVSPYGYGKPGWHGLGSEMGPFHASSGLLDFCRANARVPIELDSTPLNNSNGVPALVPFLGEHANSFQVVLGVVGALFRQQTRKMNISSSGSESPSDCASPANSDSITTPSPILERPPGQKVEVVMESLSLWANGSNYLGYEVAQYVSGMDALLNREARFPYFYGKTKKLKFGKSLPPQLQLEEVGSIKFTEPESTTDDHDVSTTTIPKSNSKTSISSSTKQLSSISSANKYGPSTDINFARMQGGLPLLAMQSYRCKDGQYIQLLEMKLLGIAKPLIKALTAALPGEHYGRDGKVTKAGKPLKVDNITPKSVTRHAIYVALFKTRGGIVERLAAYLITCRAAFVKLFAAQDRCDALKRLRMAKFRHIAVCGSMEEITEYKKGSSSTNLLDDEDGISVGSQVHHLELLKGGVVRAPLQFVENDIKDVKDGSTAPKLGQHTEEILKSLVEVGEE